MPNDFSRSSRVAGQIQRELAELIRLELKDPRVGLITLTGVDLTPDYAHAKVYYTTLAPVAERQAIETGLRRASGFLRRELGRRVRIHTLPELHFVFDVSVEQGDRLSRLIDEAVAADRKHGAE
ncbi:MAG: 30S ribosome-binding factor RbfA [Zoogloeaceae bacterium]|jgi:ribosome-binding factor A|nr:30S ribosome-binding factor RbfA [Zoogloeaceae bacterium]